MTSIHPFTRVEVRREHDWVTVVNPTNRRMLLQACDNCGVVKSENTVIQACQQPAGQRLITATLADALKVPA